MPERQVGTTRRGKWNSAAQSDGGQCLRDLPDAPSAFGRFEAARRPRVERIVKWAMRMNRSKAAGPVGRVLRDAMLPFVLKMTSDSKALRQTFDYHIDWDTASTAA